VQAGYGALTGRGGGERGEGGVKSRRGELLGNRNHTGPKRYGEERRKVVNRRLYDHTYFGPASEGFGFLDKNRRGTWGGGPRQA